MSQADEPNRKEGGYKQTMASVARWIGPTVLAVAGCALAYLSWGAWPDVLIDFGRELYVPWRLTEGDHLYADIAYLHGPLSPYINAVWLTLFGGGLRTIVLCNLAVLAATATLVFRLVAFLSDRLVATVAGLSFLTMFAFSQLIFVGNYNWVCPYSHELTHGVLLSLAAIACIARYQHHPRRRWVFIAGFAVGLVSLSKIEVFAAAILATAVGFALSDHKHDHPCRRRVADLGVLLAAILIPATAALSLLMCQMSPDVATRGVIGAWVAALGSGVQDLPFYRRGAGLADVSASLFTMTKWLAAYTGLLGTLIGLGITTGKKPRLRTPIAMGAAVILAGVLLASRHAVEWRRMASPWPVLACMITVASIVRSLRESTPLQDRRRTVVASALGVFSLVLLAKLGLNARIHHYGFAYAMPATLLIIVGTLEWLPRRIERLGGCGSAMRWSATAGMLVVMFVHADRSARLFAAKSYPVGADYDAFKADVRGDAVATMLAEIDRRVPPDATIAVMPDGVMINYLARRRSPTRYLSFMPPEMMIYGEGAILAALQADPPDFVLLAHMDTSEYGVRFFGRDYGQPILDWIRERYRPVSSVGDTPLQSERFGLLLLEVASARSSTPPRASFDAAPYGIRSVSALQEVND